MNKWMKYMIHETQTKTPKSFHVVLVNELECPFRDLHFWPQIHSIMSQTTLYNESMRLLCIFISSARCFLSNQCWHLAQSILIYAGKWSTYTQWLEVWGRGCKMGTNCSQWIFLWLGLSLKVHYSLISPEKEDHDWQINVLLQCVMSIHPHHIVLYLVYTTGECPSKEKQYSG